MQKDDHEINLTDCWRIINSNGRMMIFFTLSALAISTVFAFLLPVTYVATARILPPQSGSSSLANILAQDEGLLGSMASSLTAGNTPAELYVGILQSRTVTDQVVERFKLKKLYNLKYKEDVYRRLSDNTKFIVDRKSRIISVSVEDCDPQRAAAMANAYIEALDGINRRLNISQGQKKSRFLEERLQKVRSDLEQAENSLRDFQEKYKLVALQQQAEAAIRAAAELRAEIISASTKLEVLRQFGTERQNEAVRLKAEIKELERQLARIEGSGQDVLKEVKGAFVPISRLPELGLELARLTREAKIQEKLFGLITSQYELAKIEAARDVDVIQVLDSAVAPEKKAKPNRLGIITVSCLIALMLSVLFAFMLENLPAELQRKIRSIFTFVWFGKTNRDRV